MKSWIILIVLAIVSFGLLAEKVYNYKNNNTGCFLCWGSKNCISCSECRNCANCINCILCEDCGENHGCKKCEICFGCYSCYNCIECKFCCKCKDSNFCSECISCVKAFKADNIRPLWKISEDKSILSSLIFCILLNSTFPSI